MRAMTMILRRNRVLLPPLLLAAAMVGGDAVRAAQPPAVINYQGVLRDAAGAPRDGGFDIAFRFFDAESAGNEILVDEHFAAGTGAVTVAGGLFDVALGGGRVVDGAATLPGDPFTSLAQVFRDFASVWMEVQVSGETLLPRIRVIASAYALNADHLDGKDATQYLDTSATSQVKAGNLTVGDLIASGNDVRFGAGARAAATATNLIVTAGDVDSDDLFLFAGNSQADGAVDIIGGAQMVLRSGNGNFTFAHGLGATLATLQPDGDFSVAGGLSVGGRLSLAGGTPAEGRVLTSDGSGLASWQDLPTAQATQLRMLSDRLGAADASEAPFAAIRSFDCTGTNSATLTFTAGGASLGTVAGFVGAEAISDTYDYLIAIERPDASLVADAQIGLEGRLTLQRVGGVTTFSGIITELGLASFADGVATYVARLEPRLVRLGRSSGFRHWGSQKVSDILTTLAAETGYAAGIDATSVVHEWQGQFGETPLEVFARLAESEGLHYHFRESAGPETLSLRLTNAGFAVIPGPFNYYGDLQDPGTGEEYIATFHARSRQFTGMTTAGGWNYLTKSTVEDTTTVAGGFGLFRESFADVTSTTLADLRSRTEAQREQIRRREHSGSSHVAHLRAGHVFTLNDTTPAGFGGAYLVTEVRHWAVNDTVETCVSYGNAFSAIPSTVEYRPPRRAHPPRVHGPVAALVTHNIDTANLDRVKVRFTGDLAAAMESAWARVARPDLERRFVPDIGDEVLVDFIQGDPLAPIVVGSLFNGVDRPPAAGGDIHMVEVNNQPSVGCTPPCDQNIYFLDEGSHEGEWLGWDDAADRFELSNDLDLGLTGTLTAAGVGVTGTLSGQDLSLGDDAMVAGSLEVGGPARVNQLDVTLDLDVPILRATQSATVSGPLLVNGGLISASSALNVSASALTLSSADTRVTSSGSAGTMIDSDNNSTLSVAEWHHNGSFTAASKLAEIGETGNLRIRGTLSQAVAFDLAESFLMTEPVETGDVVSLDPRAAGAVRLTAGASDPLVIGVVSASPGVLLGGAPFDPAALRTAWGDDMGALYEKERPRLRQRVLDRHEGLRAALAADEEAGVASGLEARIDSASLEAFHQERFAAVALAGRVPVKVDASYGAIRPGDWLTPSPLPGIAMKGSGSGPTIGTALEGLDAGRGRIVALIERGRSGGGGAEASPAAPERRPSGRGEATAVADEAPAAAAAGRDLDETPFSIRRAPVTAGAGPAVEVVRVDADGNVYARGAFHAAAMDVAEYFPLSGPAAAGDVLVADPERPGRFAPARRALDPTVVGIVSGEPGVVLGGGLGRFAAADSGLAAALEVARLLGDAAREEAVWDELRARFQEAHAPVALTGTVLCKVDAGYGAIVPGDLLTTSPTTGHAMRADSPLAGTIVGKALEPLAEGTGLIRVLVMLR